MMFKKFWISPLPRHNLSRSWDKWMKEPWGYGEKSILGRGNSKCKALRLEQSGFRPGKARRSLWLGTWWTRLPESLVEVQKEVEVRKIKEVVDHERPCRSFVLLLLLFFIFYFCTTQWLKSISFYCSWVYGSAGLWWSWPVWAYPSWTCSLRVVAWPKAGYSGMASFSCMTVDWLPAGARRRLDHTSLQPAG